jgi:peptide deformylase
MEVKMALRNIIKVGDATLTKKSRKVTDFNKRLWELLDDMRDTMIEANGTGLAAPQVGILRRAALVASIVPRDEDSVVEGEEDEEEEEIIIELINPEIIEVNGEQTGLEGCLSLPGVWGIVTRPMRVKVRAQDRYGEYFEAEGEGLTARAFCHEIAHLNGEMFTEVADKILDSKEIEAMMAEREKEQETEADE